MLSTSFFAQQETANEAAEESSVNIASDPTTEKTSQDIEFLFRPELPEIEPSKDDDLLLRLLNRVKDALGVPVHSTTFWVENSAVVGWMKEKPSDWRVFIANRVAEI